MCTLSVKACSSLGHCNPQPPNFNTNCIISFFLEWVAKCLMLPLDQSTLMSFDAESHNWPSSWNAPRRFVYCAMTVVTGSKMLNIAEFLCQIPMWLEPFVTWRKCGCYPWSSLNCNLCCSAYAQFLSAKSKKQERFGFLGAFTVLSSFFFHRNNDCNFCCAWTNTLLH